jgi:hypothetical protein
MARLTTYKFHVAAFLWHKARMLDECAAPLPAEPIASPPDRHDYRRLARQIRDIARQTRLPVARTELLRIAANYDRRGDHLDQRAADPPHRLATGTIDPVHNGVERDLIAFVPDHPAQRGNGIYIAACGPTVEPGAVPHIDKAEFVPHWDYSVLDGTRPDADHCAHPSPAAFRLVVERLGVRFGASAVQ